MRIEDKKLLQKYLYGQCSTEEKIRLRELLQHGDTPRILEELTLKEWSEPAIEDKEIDGIVAEWKTRINTKILDEMGEQGGKTTLIQPFQKLTFLKYAVACAGLVLLASLVVWQFVSINSIENIVALERTNKHGQPVKYILPDSSEVYLAAGSTINYPQHFDGSTREINLYGEAFFDIKRDESRPFIIHTGKIQTKVLGTSFKINAFKNSKLVVSVATGRVRVSKLGDEKTEALALLTAGQKVTWDGVTGKSVKGEVDVYSLEQWKSGEMVFDDQSMLQIAAELHRRYGITVDFRDSEIRGNKLSGTFPSNKSIDKVMTALAMAGKFQFETKDNKTFKIFKTSKQPM